MIHQFVGLGAGGYWDQKEKSGEGVWRGEKREGWEGDRDGKDGEKEREQKAGMQQETGSEERGHRTGGEAGRKGSEKASHGCGKAGGRLSPKPYSGYPSKPHRLSAPQFWGDGGRKGADFHEWAGKGWLETAHLHSSGLSLYVPACLLGKISLLYRDITLYIYIAASSTGVRFRRLPTARHCSRKAERGPTQPAKPLSPFPKSLSLLAFLIPKQSPNRGTLPPFLWGKGGFSSLRKAGKAFLATHSRFYPLFLLLRPPQISHPLLQYVPFGGGKRLLSAALSS